jgi:hypothetical protein
LENAYGDHLWKPLLEDFHNLNEENVKEKGHAILSPNEFEKEILEELCLL